MNTGVSSGEETNKVVPRREEMNTGVPRGEEMNTGVPLGRAAQHRNSQRGEKVNTRHS